MVSSPYGSDSCVSIWYHHSMGSGTLQKKTFILCSLCILLVKLVVKTFGDIITNFTNVNGPLISNLTIYLGTIYGCVNIH
jgi:hypothetical protein